MCLIANVLEQRGTPTLVMGSALDIMAAGRPPRGVFFDAPLGHTCGAPDEADQQRAILRGALAAFDAITEPGTIVPLPERWKAGEAWKSQASDSSGGDSRQPRDTSPQWQHPEDAVAADAD